MGNPRLHHFILVISDETELLSPCFSIYKSQGKTLIGPVWVTWLLLEPITVANWMCYDER